MHKLMKKMMHILKIKIRLFRKFEHLLLIFIVSMMVVVSFLQIVLKFFKSGVEWFSPFLKYSVLWTGMIAAGIATYENKHIKIDLIGRFARGKLKKIVNIVTALFAGIVCLVLGIISYIYIIKIELLSNEPAPFLNIERWVLLMIMPIGFFLISIRFFSRIGLEIIQFNLDEEETKTDILEIDF